MWLTGEVTNHTGTAKLPLQPDQNYAEATADYKEEIIIRAYNDWAWFVCWQVQH